MRNKSLVIFTIFTLCLGLSGCRQPISNPESVDPIYADLENRARQSEMAAEAEAKAIKAVDEQIPQIAPRDPMKKQLIREKYGREKRLVQLRQEAEYFKIRAEQRKAFAKREYLKAFEKEEPWPKPQEFDAYKATKDLRNASKNWEDRVPKLTRHQKAQPGATGTAPAAADGEKPAPAAH